MSRSAATHAVWAHTPERSNILMLRVMTWISLRLGRRPARLVLHLIATYFLLFAPRGRRASRDYLALALGRAVRWRDLYRHFFTFASTIHDRVYLINGRFDLFEFELHGEEKLRELLADGQGLFLLGAHLGSFEVVRALGRQVGDLTCAMVMHEENARKINSMLAAINPTAAQDIIGLGSVDAMLQVRDRLDAGQVVGVLADRTTGDDAREQVTLLDQPVALPSGPFRMAALLRRPVVFMTGLYLGGNRYAIHFDLLADFSAVPRTDRASAVQGAIASYAGRLDHYCRVAPFNWFNFYDFWKPVDAGSKARL